MAVTTECQIRWCLRRDLPEIMPIECLSCSEPWSSDDFIEFLRARNSIGMVSEIEGQIVGFIMYSLTAAKLEIANLAVHPDWRRQGIGTTILQRMKMKVVQVSNRDSLEVWVCETNLPFQLFLKSQGFEWCQTERERYGERDGYLFRWEPWW